MNQRVIIPGPELILWWGVQLPLLAAAFGVTGVLLGHLIAGAPAVPVPLPRQIGIVAAGVLLSLAITIATGQRPLVVLSWSIGIGFSGIKIFQTLGDQAARATKEMTEAFIDKFGGRQDAAEEDKPA